MGIQVSDEPAVRIQRNEARLAVDRDGYRVRGRPTLFNKDSKDSGSSQENIRQVLEDVKERSGRQASSRPLKQPGTLMVATVANPLQ